MKVKRVIEIMEANGWKFVRYGKGSHRVFAHPNFQLPQIVPGKPGDDLATGMLAKIRQETGIKELR